MCKICNYFIDFNKYDFIHKEIKTKSNKNTNKKTFNSKKRLRLVEYGNLEEVQLPTAQDKQSEAQSVPPCH